MSLLISFIVSSNPKHAPRATTPVFYTYFFFVQNGIIIISTGAAHGFWNSITGLRKRFASVQQSLFAVWINYVLIIFPFIYSTIPFPHTQHPTHCWLWRVWCLLVLRREPIFLFFFIIIHNREPNNNKSVCSGYTWRYIINTVCVHNQPSMLSVVFFRR